MKSVLKRTKGSGRDEKIKVLDGSQATRQDLLLMIKWKKKTRGVGIQAVEGDLFLAEVAEGFPRADEEELQGTNKMVGNERGGGRRRRIVMMMEKLVDRLGPPHWPTD